MTGIKLCFAFFAVWDGGMSTARFSSRLTTSTVVGRAQLGSAGWFLSVFVSFCQFFFFIRWNDLIYNLSITFFLLTTMNNLNLPKNLVNNLTEAVLRQLQSGNNATRDNAQQEPVLLHQLQSGNNIIRDNAQQHLSAVVQQLVPQLLRQPLARQPLATPPTPSTPSTPVVRSDSSISSASLQRCDSSASTSSYLSRSDSSASSASLSSVHQWGDMAEDDDDSVSRRRTSDEDKFYMNTVRRPVLEIVDSKYCALHPDVDNALFRRRFKRKRNSDGSRTLKRNKDIVLPLFRQLTGPVLRRLTRLLLQQGTAGVTYCMIRRKLYVAALKVVKKRRANHIQSWRPDRNNTHKPLIYGDEIRPAVGLFTSPTPGGLAAPAFGATPPPPPAVGVPTPAPPAPPAPSSQATPDVDFSVDPTPPTPATPAPSSQATPDVDFPVCDVKCCDCGKLLTKNSAHPKDDDQEWGVRGTEMRCEGCWRKHVTNDMINVVENPGKRAEHIRSSQNPSKRQKKNRKTTGKCNWCGETTHKTKRSKKCRYNKHSMMERLLKQAVDAGQIDAAAAADEQIAAATVDGEEIPAAATAVEQIPAAAAAGDEQIAAATGDEQIAAAAAGDEQGDVAAADDVWADVPPPLPVFQIGENVLVVRGRRKYLAQVFKINGDNHHVYYVDNGDNEVVKRSDLRTEPSPTPNRRDFLARTFHFDGADDLEEGLWKVRRIAESGVEFVCTRLTGGSSRSQSVEKFDIAYVMTEVRKHEEHERARGPMHSSRRYR